MQSHLGEAVNMTSGGGKTLLQEFVNRIGQREFQNTYAVSGDPSLDGTKILEGAISELARRLCEDIVARGMRPLPDTFRTSLAHPGPDPIDNHIRMAARVRAELSDNPRDLIIFLTYIVQELHERADASMKGKQEWMSKCARMWEKVATAESIKALRSQLRDYDEDWF